MSFGAVAMFDVLGFKGIWKEERSKGRWRPADVVGKMAFVEAMAEEMRSELQEKWPQESEVDLRTRVLCLSDTIIVLTSVNPVTWSPYTDNPQALREHNDELRALKEAEWYLQCFACLKLTAIIGARAIGAGLLGPPEFNYRGAISVGDFTASQDHNYFLGPAVDECAGHYENAQGAFVLLCPSATQFLERAHQARDLVKQTSERLRIAFDTDLVEILDTPQIVPYSVPVRPSRKTDEIVNVDTYAINPFITWSGSSWADRADTLLSLFAGGENELKKKAFTSQFFEYVIANARSLDDQGLTGDHTTGGTFGC